MEACYLWCDSRPALVRGLASTRPLLAVWFPDGSDVHDSLATSLGSARIQKAQKKLRRPVIWAVPDPTLLGMEEGSYYRTEPERARDIRDKCGGLSRGWQALQQGRSLVLAII